MKYNYCPKCGQGLQKVILGVNKVPRLKCAACGFIFYQNSKPTASALIVKGDKVLLGKRSIEPYKNYWDILGGFLELGESPAAGARREIKEETGLEIELVDLLGIFMDEYGPGGDPTLNICYLAKITAGEPKPADDVDELRWFTASDLPKNLAFKNSREIIDLWLKKQLTTKPE
ncbi:MAG: NUDIX hydrolase [Candidatus Kerfeldbacteria bacterium]|nr:NUDIX hydrolase [Candidatus Kerfeldbacteria bacterium]